MSGSELKRILKRAPSGPISRILYPARRARPRSFLWARGRPRARAADPETEPLSGKRDGRPLSPYLALLRMGFTVPPPLPAERCALTAPFHPCRPFGRRFVFCGTFLRVAATGGYPACCPCGVRTFLSGPPKRSPERSRGPLGAVQSLTRGPDGSPSSRTRPLAVPTSFPPAGSRPSRRRPR